MISARECATFLVKSGEAAEEIERTILCAIEARRPLTAEEAERREALVRMLTPTELLGKLRKLRR